MAARGLFVGLTTLDLLYAVDALPRGDEKVVARRQTIAAGGPAANAAVTYAALGGHATLVTRLGDHPLARLARADLASRAVDVLDVCPAHEGPPPVSSILSTGSERAVVSVNAGAFDTGPLVDVPEVGDCAVVLADGHHAELAVPLVSAARRRGVPVLLDAGSWKPAAEPLLGLVTVVLCSADFRMPGVEPGEPLLRALLDRGAEWAGISAGEGPIRWASRGGGGLVPVPAVAVADTLGAGDVLHGALAYGLAGSAGTRPARLLAAAAEVASGSCRTFGTREWLGG
ncbi:MAG TPA: PfkB family carbohydrate kinase [Mycobacteriales bacterium]